MPEGELGLHTIVRFARASASASSGSSKPAPTGKCRIRASCTSASVSYSEYVGTGYATVSPLPSVARNTMASSSSEPLPARIMLCGIE